jgi:hypothetical protein
MAVTSEDIKASISRWVGRDYIDGTNRRLLSTALDEIQRLEAEIQRLKAEATHWKANHAGQVERARILIERPDLPAERVKAYHLIGELQAKLAAYEAKEQ